MKTWNLGYEKCKQKAKNIYTGIGRISSPALNNDIYFTSVGFNHLVRKGRIPRTRNEQKKRFVLLPYVETILKNPKAVIEYRENELKSYKNIYGNKTLVNSTARFWTFVETLKDCRIKVVIRQVDQGNFHFLSIMGDKFETRKKKTIHKKSP